LLGAEPARVAVAEQILLNASALPDQMLALRGRCTGAAFGVY
jgi:hypothetical protein